MSKSIGFSGSENEIAASLNLKPFIIDKCNEFRAFYYSVCNKWGQKHETIEQIKHKVEEIKIASQESLEELLQYLRHKIVTNYHVDLMIPYYSISKELHQPLD